MLSAHGLTLWRGSTCLFEDLGFAAEAGSVLLVHGPNGSGKTTLLRVVAGLTRPERGEVLWDGEPLLNHRSGHSRIAYSGHAVALKPELTVRENLHFYSRLLGYAGSVQPILEAAGLAACADLRVRVLSAGQRRRSALARLLMSDAPLWILDEPQTNLDAAGRSLVNEIIARHVARQGIALVATHQPLDIETGAVTVLQLGEG